MTRFRRALLSVSDKTGLVELASRLIALDIQVVSTGGTLRHLHEAGLDVVPVSELTGFPEVFDGRVKTLHPHIHGGILFRRGHGGDEATCAELGIRRIDLVVVNLYPFEATVAQPTVTLEQATEQIDIGGPALVRAAAKNSVDVAVVVDPDDYDEVALALEEHGRIPPEMSRALALKAFRHTGAYDLAIADFLSMHVPTASLLIDRGGLVLRDPRPLRYGENPHQRAAVYESANLPYLGGGECLQGKELSYNNLIDLSAALEVVAELVEPAVVIVKHTNPCGVGSHASDVVAAYDLALAGDPTSAFGGIVALNRPCTPALASKIAERFYEIVAAPSYDAEALELLAPKVNLRVVLVDTAQAVTRTPLSLRTTPMGVLAQTVDPPVTDADEAAWRVATRRTPSEAERAALAFVWRVVKHVKSNAIVVGSTGRTYGIGAGQMSRVDAVRLALSKATGRQAPFVLASDAFFPFRDNVDVAAAGGVTALIQPGGSRRDDEVIAAADEHGMAMVLTGRRHFKH